MSDKYFTAYNICAGFVIFYDFLLSLEPTIQACRLVVGLHSSSAVMGEPTVLPTVYSEPATRGERFNYNYSNAVIGAKQPVPRCPPESDLGIVVELQASGGPASEHDRHSLITRAWTKIPLFDNNSQLISGRFRIPMRNVPIKPFLHVSQVQRVNKYGDAELYYRIVNMRDAEIHSMQQITAANYNQYTHPQIPGDSFPKKKSVQPAPLTPQERLPSIQHRAPRSTSPPQVMALQDMMLGFQVDRVKKAEAGEGKVRLTAYYASTGKVVQSSTSPVTCSTTAVRSNFKYGYHVFGQQEASFEDVEYQGDMVLIARFYLKKRDSDVLDDFVMPEQGGQEPTLYDEETCVAWSFLPLVRCEDNLPLKKRKTFNPNSMSINDGTHTMPLFQPPIPEPNQVPLNDQPYTRDWQRYGKATLRVYVFQGQPRPGSLTPSDISDIDEEETLPEFAWLPMERKTPIKEPYLLGDGFDVYIDGCRYLPDSATFTKVAGRILDRRYDLYGKDINTNVKLDSDVYNPVYEEKIEFRETNIPPTATLLLKVYTIDNFYKTLTVVGYCTLNVFVETGTERQPNVDKPMQVSLNEGAHQLRLFAQGPNGVDPLTESCLRDSGVRIVPCASVLVRLVKVAKGPGGKALESAKVPKGDWLRMGLWQPRPKYSDRIYYSSKCMPTRGETRLFHSMMRRTRRSIREVIALVASAKESFLRSDKNMEEYIRTQLTKTADAKPLDQDLNFICQYSPKHGIKVSVDSAVNLPWSNFTHAHMCFNPPAAFYLGAPHATYDKLTFTELLDVRSTNTSPQWKDGFKHFPRRSFHRFLTMIIHLQEISVSVAKENYKYGLLEQAWTAVQIFTDKYCTTQAFQLPLFAGTPSQTILKQLAREPCKEWMERNIRNNGIHLLEGSSIFVRVADARRDDELVSDISHNKLVEVNTDYIPVGLEESYSRERPGKPLETLVPVGKTPDQFVDNLKVKFKSLVYKLYEEGNLNK
ncbi:Coiled-coil domain-containing protein 17 [Mactra antiquata]